MEIVKTIIDKENGRKWEFIFLGKDKYGEHYTYKYYEFFKNEGWRHFRYCIEERYSKEAIEFEFGIKL